MFSDVSCFDVEARQNADNSTIPLLHLFGLGRFLANQIALQSPLVFLNQMRPDRIHIDVEPSRLLIAWSKEKYIVNENKTTTAISIKLFFHI